MTEYAIHTEHLSRSFGTLQAVDDLSLSISSGTIFGFLGANGAGKTTTIHMLLGLLEPTSGYGRAIGFDIRTQAGQIREHAGALLEFNGLYERMSAADNLEFYGRIYQIPDALRHARIKELLIHLELWDRRHEYVVRWSRGMKQKLAVARALLHRPALVFLDEPTAGLDPVAATVLNNDLVSIVKREGTTVFLNTHQLTDAEKYCDQVGVIRKGKLLAVGSPDELRTRIKEPQVEITGHKFNEDLLSLLRQQEGVRTVELHNNHMRLKLFHESKVAPLVSLIVREGGEIEEVRRGQGSLEEVFEILMKEGS